MVDFAQPDNASLKVDVLSLLNSKMNSVATMNYAGDSSLPVGVPRWNTANNRFEQWTGSSWAALSSAYAINVNQLGGQSASYYLNAGHINAGTLSAARLPTASTTAAGAVQLSAATTSTSTTVAATASAVNAIRAIAEAKANAAHSHGVGDLPSASTSARGVVQLNSSTTSTSSSQAATPAAVKAVRDLLPGSASTSIAGLVVRATQTEVNAGSDGSHYVTPATLASRLSAVLGGITAASVGALPSGSKAVDSDKLDGYDYTAFGRLSATNTWQGANTFSQRVTMPSYTITSDQRKKTNVRPLSVHECTVILKKINWILFDWRDRTDTNVPGVIAQQLLQIYPPAVFEVEGFYHVDYMKIYNLQMRVSQDHELRIAKLEAEQ